MKQQPKGTIEKPLVKVVGRTNKCVCGFHYRTDAWMSFPQAIFKPVGLAIWNAPPGAVMRQALIGTRMEVMVSFDAIPVRFFAFGDNYEQIGKLLEEGKDPPAWCDWDMVNIGNHIRIELASASGAILSPKDGIELCMWGLCTDF